MNDPDIHWPLALRAAPPGPALRTAIPALAVVPLAVLFGLGCDSGRGDVPAAEVATTPESSEATTPAPNDQASGDQATPGQAIDTANSTFEFTGVSLSGRESGHFEDWAGTISVAEPVEESRVSITVQMASVQTEKDRLTQHLSSDDFFSVANHPTATFESTSFAAAEPGAPDATHRVTGQLTLRGHTETITFPVHLDVTDSETRAQAEFTFDRQRFGVSYRGAEDHLIQDEVSIRFDVRAPRG